MKIKFAHLLINSEKPKSVDQEEWNSFLSRQNQSISSFSKIESNFEYVQVYNNKFEGPAPIETCDEPSIYIAEQRMVPKDGGSYLSSGHYGAFMAHKEAILNEFTPELDAIVIIESDVVICVPEEEFNNWIYKTAEFGIKNQAAFITLSNVLFGQGSDADQDIIDHGEWKKINHFLCCNCYMIFNTIREDLQSKLREAKWMEFDIWLYWNFDKRVNIFQTSQILAHEVSGFSLIDLCYKESNYLP